MNKKLTYISLFSSAGVGCYGFKLNNFECIATNELLTKRIQIQKYNNKCRYDEGYLNDDITKDSIKNRLFDQIDFWKSKHNIKEPDVIISTPPCQGMSVANHKKVGKEMVRNSLVVESIKITKDVRPKFFVFENVRFFLTTICTDVDGVDKPIRDAINLNLSGDYNILFKVINFKEYGSNSSRTRTLVLGVRKDLKDISPYDIFPNNRKPKTLRKLFKDLPALAEMGDISEDILHSFRKYDERMLPWIETLSEGQSAFENVDIERLPHRIIDGVRVENQSKNGDKYARWFWDREGPCVHTRNDILSSQNTVHPSENRVFSIRELMRMMSIPDTFKWSENSLNILNDLSFQDKTKFLKKEELNIRHCIGEAVPTGVFKSIASNIKLAMENKTLSISDINKLIQENNLSDTTNIITFIENHYGIISLSNLLLIAELSNSKRQSNSAYFTRKDIAYSVIKDLPELKNKKSIRILEPSVGVGNFIPLLIEKYKTKANVIIDVIDLDADSLRILKVFISFMRVPKHIKINIINHDFLTWNAQHQYDLIVGNPPYGKLTKNNDLLSLYKKNAHNIDTNNIFSFFIDKALSIGKHVSLIVPKSLLNSPEFNSSRKLLNTYNLIKICDFGEKAFRGVKIETINLLVDVQSKNICQEIIIESYIKNTYNLKNKQYIFSSEFPYWLIYRNTLFDGIANTMDLGIFNSFRDRQITKLMTKNKGNIRVLKARNIGNNAIKNLVGYDKYIDSTEKLAVARFLNNENVVMVPNLTYYPRASFLPADTIVDGSVALLTRRNGSRLPTMKDLDFYSTKEFEAYYRVARNHGTRSLNIDNNSVFFFGIIKHESL